MAQTTNELTWICAWRSCCWAPACYAQSASSFHPMDIAAMTYSWQYTYFPRLIFSKVQTWTADFDHPRVVCWLTTATLLLYCSSVVVWYLLTKTWRQARREECDRPSHLLYFWPCLQYARASTSILSNHSNGFVVLSSCKLLYYVYYSPLLVDSPPCKESPACDKGSRCCQAWNDH